MHLKSEKKKGFEKELAMQKKESCDYGALIFWTFFHVAINNNAK